jgi:hypothetical protein
MPNDFLSSLASRALQHTEVDLSADRLSPRLASRFEISARQVLPEPEQALDTEQMIEVETKHEGGRRKTAPAPGQGEPEKEDIQAGRSEQDPARVMMPEKHGSEEAIGFLQPAPGPTLIKHSEPILGAFPAEGTPIKVEPASTARVELSDPLGKLSVNRAKNQDTLLSETGSRSRTVSMNPVSPQMRNPAREVLLPDRVIEPKPVMPARALPEVQSENERKVILQPIESTEVEPRLPKTSKSPPIVPAVMLPDLKPQRAVPEAPEQLPTIQVTIGRIEVKATTSGPSQKPRTSASQTMSLEEYLRRRQGGER